MLFSGTSSGIADELGSRLELDGREPVGVPLQGRRAADGPVLTPSVTSQRSVTRRLALAAALKFSVVLPEVVGRRRASSGSGRARDRQRARPACRGRSPSHARSPTRGRQTIRHLRACSWLPPMRRMARRRRDCRARSRSRSAMTPRASSWAGTGVVRAKNDGDRLRPAPARGRGAASRRSCCGPALVDSTWAYAADVRSARRPARRDAGCGGSCPVSRSLIGLRGRSAAGGTCRNRACSAPGRSRERRVEPSAERIRAAAGRWTSERKRRHPARIRQRGRLARRCSSRGACRSRRSAPRARCTRPVDRLRARDSSAWDCVSKRVASRMRPG